MRTPAAFLAGAASATILAIGWQAGAAALTAATSTATAAATTTGSATSTTPSTAPTAATSTGTPTSSSSPTPTSTPTPTTGVRDGSYTGTAVNTRYGIVQVTAVISGGKLVDIQNTNVNATGGRLQAVPTLKQEALQAQSANIQIVSNATYTSEGYMQSLQAALNAAGFTG